VPGSQLPPGRQTSKQVQKTRSIDMYVVVATWTLKGGDDSHDEWSVHTTMKDARAEYKMQLENGADAAAIADIKEATEPHYTDPELTCYTCNKSDKCDFRDDPYNTDGDCLMMK
jgi:hypothetical protein